MSQWREPESHNIAPKLIFSTGSNSQYGLKAFVVSDDWHVKHHGGTRQVFHYTGCQNPLRGAQLGGLPNNLGGAAAQLFDAMTAQGATEEDFLLYVAAFYNSTIPTQFVDEGGGNVLNIPMIPAEDACDLARLARRVRDFTYALQTFPIDSEVSASSVHYDLQPYVDEGLIEVRRHGGGRFQSTSAYVLTSELRTNMLNEMGDAQAHLEELVLGYYGL